MRDHFWKTRERKAETEIVEMAVPAIVDKAEFEEVLAFGTLDEEAAEIDQHIVGSHRRAIPALKPVLE